jgi:hypothetical protein
MSVIVELHNRGSHDPNTAEAPQRGKKHANTIFKNFLNYIFKLCQKFLASTAE